MSKKSLFLCLIIILFVHIQSQIKPISFNTNIGIKNPNIFSSLKFPSVLLADASVYRGQAKVQIIQGQTQSIQYFITFFEHKENCEYKRCFYGYVNNYTHYDQEEGQIFVEGYQNEQLQVKPIFKFETNGIQDYNIIHEQEIQFIWSQIIQISCQKLNPQIQEPVVIRRLFQPKQDFNLFSKEAIPINKQKLDIIQQQDILKNKQKPEIIQQEAIKKNQQKLDISQQKTIPINKQKLDILQQEDILINKIQSRYKFIQQETSNIRKENPDLKYGSRLATINEDIIVKDLQTEKSFLKQSVRLNKDNQIGLIKQQYSFNIVNQKKSQDDIVIPDFAGKVQLNLLLQQKIKVSKNILNNIIKQINTKNRTKPLIKLSAQALQTLRITRYNIQLINDLISDDQPQPGDFDSEQFGNQRYTGVDVVQEFQKNKPKPPIKISAQKFAIFKEPIVPQYLQKDTKFQLVKTQEDQESQQNQGSQQNEESQQDEESTQDKESYNPLIINKNIIQKKKYQLIPKNAFTNKNRFLPPISKTKIVDNTKTIWSRTILGKPVNVKFRYFCQLWVWPTDHQIHCQGWVLFNLFGNSKTYKVLSITKSVSFTWSYSNSWSGSNTFKLWIGLPKPVNFIGLDFYISVSYRVDLAVSAQNTNLSPYTIKVVADTRAKLDTDSSAGLRLIVVQGGVFIKGTLANVKTSPQAIAKYYFAQQKIELRIKWYAQLFTFQAYWGFYWRYWRLFKGWSGKKTIAKWDLKSNYYKFKIMDKSYTINV